MASNAFLHIKPHPALGHGTGVFARKELLPGSIIFEEQPLCRAGGSDESKEDAYNAMKKSDKQRFLTLYGACCCTDPTYCNESIVTKIWHINAFSHENGTFIYHLASHFNHACLPNAIWEINDQATMKIQVIRKIEEGEEVTVAYFDTIEGRKSGRNTPWISGALIVDVGPAS